MTHNIISIDPGKTHCYLSLFQDGILEAVSKHPVDYSRLLHNRPKDLLHKLPLISEDPETGGNVVTINEVICEWMDARDGRGSIREQQNNIDLMFSARCCIYDLQMCWSILKFIPVKPKQWSVVKKHIRAKRIIRELSRKELKIIEPFKNNRKDRVYDYNHNILDSAGIGLWRLHRMR